MSIRKICVTIGLAKVLGFADNLALRLEDLDENRLCAGARQGCPLSGFIFAIAVHPFFCDWVWESGSTAF